jgi:hypothetical protein
MSHEDESVTPVTTHSPQGFIIWGGPHSENCCLFWRRPCGCKIKRPRAF